MTEQSEKSRWDARYAKSVGLGNVSALLIESAEVLPTSGRALDIAGGSGADALFLASTGLETTLLDLSPEALAIARAESEMMDLPLQTVALNTEVDPLPEGPWDVIHIGHYLHRPTITAATRQLRPGGLLIIAIATITNLERRARPPARFLLQPGELVQLVATTNVQHLPDATAQNGVLEDGEPQDDVLEDGVLEVLRFDEDWRPNGIHEAWLIARR